MNRKLLFIILLITVGNIYSQVLQTRYNFGALLEPKDKIIHGAGQDATAFNNYWNVMSENTKPAVFMTYIDLKTIQSNWTDELKRNILSYGNQFIIPQIGLSMTSDGNPSSHYEGDVAAGLYDQQIENFIEGLRRLAIPAYVRIGYEFNGVSWNGYQPVTYKNAFVRITNKIRESGLEVATLWCFAMDGVMNYMDYYPGDNVVDWWAIDMFSTNHLTDANASRFVDSAYAHSKPVMIGESTPRSVGVLQGLQSWNTWFKPYFNFIHSKPAVKGFCYINWDWSQFPQWSNWGDARLEMNTAVAAHFKSEMDSTEYLHSSSEQIFRKAFGYQDDSAPQTPQNLNVVSSDYPVKLSWDPVTDLSGLSHYIIYKNGVICDYTLNASFSDYNISAGDTVEYTISAIDRAGNESPASFPIVACVPYSVDKALNGQFDEGNQFWNLNIYDQNASAAFEIDAGSVISGINSAKIRVTKSSSTNWHIQLAQSFNMFAKNEYKVIFKAKSSVSKTIDFAIQQAAAPYNIYLSKQVSLTSTSKTFSDSVTVNTNDFVKLEFFLGSSGTADIWIDEVSIIESSPVTELLLTSAPVLTSPLNGTESLPQNLIIKWNNLKNAQSYQLVVSTDSTFSTKIIDTSSITAQSFQLKDLSLNTIYYWKVRGVNQYSIGPWTNTWKFKTLSEILSAPVLSYPADKAIDIPLSTKLKWYKNPNASRYKLQVSLDSIFTTKLINFSDIEDTSYSISNLNGKTKYYWRVAGANENSTSTWSDVWEFSTVDLTSVNVSENLPKEFALNQNYPNPFNPSTVISYHLPVGRQGYQWKVTLKVFNSLGKEIETLVDKYQEAGFHSTLFTINSSLPSGIYFYQLRAGNFYSTKKLMVIK